MCGIAGVCHRDAARGRLAVEQMCEQMVPRGPDDCGIELLRLGARPLALGSRRLAIVDPTTAGHQPMRHPATGHVLVFNGMIYNFRELRAELADTGAVFVSGSDTEVILHAYARWGLGCVARLEGMFAFALLDAPRERLVLARDRLGIKPLYYWTNGGDLAFASQVRAILDSGLVPRRLSCDGIASFLATGSVQEPLTAIEGLRAAPAGHVGVFDGKRLSFERYWAPPREIDPTVIRHDAERELLERLDQSVGRHLVADRPVGIFLSGGVDSSTIGALAARRGAVRTVGVAFEENAYSEGRFAHLVASSIGSRHTEVVLTAAELRESLDSAFAAMDQPTFDGINTYVVSRAAAATGVRVALSGLGADELFDGYGHLRRIQLLARFGGLPRPLARLGAAFISVGRTARSKKAAEWLGAGGGSGAAYALLRQLYGASDVSRLVPAWNADGVPTSGPWAAPGDPGNRLAIAELEGYMRNVLLRDTDAMSMANSLEVRVPFLHDPLVDWALRLPPHVRGPRKALLIAAMRPVLPQAVIERRKHGFLLPIAHWLRGDLGREVEQRIAVPSPAVAELVDREVALGEWRRFLLGRSSWLRPWSIYALDRWAEQVLA